MYTNLPTSQGYIFRILQHFATKICSFSNFDNFFPEISFAIPRLKIFLKRKSSIRPFKIECSRIAGRQIVSDYVNKVYPSIQGVSKKFSCRVRKCYANFDKSEITFKFRKENRTFLAIKMQESPLDK